MQITLRQEKNVSGHLHFNARRIKRFSPLEPSIVSITRHFIPERTRVEKFIESIYFQNFNAVISRHYPTLMSIRDCNDTILGALGFRQAGEQRLFLENYIDTPIEAEMSKIYGTSLTRDGIIEIGNLASKGEGAAIFLIPALMAYLKQQGYSHVTFTATKGLYCYFKNIGVNPQVIASADQNRLPDGGASWGTYYDSCPQIIGGDVSFAADRLQHFLGVELHSLNTMLYSRLHPAIATD